MLCNFLCSPGRHAHPTPPHPTHRETNKEWAEDDEQRGSLLTRFMVVTEAQDPPKLNLLGAICVFADDSVVCVRITVWFLNGSSASVKGNFVKRSQTQRCWVTVF